MLFRKLFLFLFSLDTYGVALLDVRLLLLLFVPSFLLLSRLLFRVDGVPDKESAVLLCLGEEKTEVVFAEVRPYHNVHPVV